MNYILNELKKFSKENWWIFVLLIIALVIVYITWKWSLLEIFILFLANFLWNVFIMMMQNNYTNWNNKIGSSYYLVSLTIFICIWIYWLIYLWQSQYIVWQIAYTLSWIKAFTYYNFSKNLSLLNEKTFIPLNIILFTIFILYFNYETYSIIQAIWFSLITTWLVSIKDKIRYWLNLIWIWFLTFWSLWWVVVSFNSWSLDWVALWFFCLTWTVLIYYLKLLKKYL